MYVCVNSNTYVRVHVHEFMYIAACMHACMDGWIWSGDGDTDTADTDTDRDGDRDMGLCMCLCKI